MKTGASGRSIELLLVEDNPADIRLTLEAFKEGKVVNQLHVVMDGVEAMAFLRREDKYAEAPRPDVILLDLNLPLMDGREVLKAIKNDPQLKSIPVVVLTTSQVEMDICRSYDLQASCYVCKPLDFDRFIEIVQLVKAFWLSVVVFPGE